MHFKRTWATCTGMIYLPSDESTAHVGYSFEWQLNYPVDIAMNLSNSRLKLLKKTKRLS